MLTIIWGGTSLETFEDIRLRLNGQPEMILKWSYLVGGEQGVSWT